MCLFSSGNELAVSFAAILHWMTGQRKHTSGTKSMNMQARSTGAVHFWISDEFTRECFPYIAHDCLDGTAATTTGTRERRERRLRVYWPGAKQGEIYQARSYVRTKIWLPWKIFAKTEMSRKERYDIMNFFPSNFPTVFYPRLFHL